MTPEARSRRRYIVGAMVLLALVAGLVAFSAISFLQHAAMNAQRARLTEQARAEAQFILAIARNEQSEGRDLAPATDEALQQANEALEAYRPAAATGDVQVAKLEGDLVVFLVWQRFGEGLPSPVRVGGSLAVPMQRALSGESGTMIGLDYRGVSVLAAYEPVADLGLGVVAKVDLAEVRAPFRRAALLSLGPAIGVILLGGGLLLILNRPVLQRAREAERRYEELVDALGEGVIVQDESAKITYVNQRMCEMLGYRSEELVGRATAELFASESRSAFGRELDRRRRGEKGEYEAVMARRDGEFLVVLIAARVLRNARGEFAGSFGVITDVTELRRQSQRLAHLNAVLRAIRNVNQLITREKDRDRLLEQGCRELVATEGICRAWVAQLDASGRAVRVAQAGIGPAPAFDALRESLLRGDLPSCCRQALATGMPFALADPSAACVECPGRIAHPGIAAAAVPLRHEGELLGVLVAALPHAWAKDPEQLSLLLEVAGDMAFALHDLNEADALKAAEAALHASEERHRLLFENAVLGIYLTAPDGRILAANPALVAMLGYDSFEELAARDLEAEGYHPEYPRSGFKRRMEEEGRIDGLESAWVRKDGTSVYVRENAVAIRNSDGKIMLYEGTVEDVTARRLLEVQLRNSQKLESIGTLASGIAHEINNPLTGIINYGQLILERTEKDALRGFAQGIIEEGNRVASIVKNLLAFSRQQKESHSPARVADIVEATLSLIGRSFGKDGIEIDVDMPDDLPSLRCRSQQIQQVLMNLLLNARDALNARYAGPDENKRIRVTAVRADRDGRAWIRFSVEDWGIGMPPDVMQRVFDPFFTTKPRDQGTGLGLSISYGIVREHRGTLSVESKPGVWTRFTLDLPLGGDGDQPPPGKPPEEEWGDSP